MPFPLIGAAIQAGGALLGGVMQNRAARSQNAAQVRAIREANNLAAHREDTRIRRIVKDANAAGIHPLAALGSPTVGTFATPQAAYGGQPISGSGIGDAIQSVGSAVGSIRTNLDSLQEQLLKAQIGNVNASTMTMLADARSRSVIAGTSAATRAAAGLPPATRNSIGAPYEIGIFDLFPKIPGEAQRGQDDAGDIWEQLIGTFNLEPRINRSRMGPASGYAYDQYQLYKKWKEGK